MGDHAPLRPGAPSMLARVLGREVAANPSALGARQRRLDQQEVRVAGYVDDLLAGPGIGAVDGLAAAVRADPHGEGLDEMRNRLKSGTQVADLNLAAGRVLLEAEGALDQVVVAPGPNHLPEGLLGVWRCDQPRTCRVVRPFPGVNG